MKYFVVLLLACSLACSTNPQHTTALLGPTADTAIVYDNSVRWDAALPGLVTVTNTRATPLTLTFGLMNRVSESNQRLESAAIYVLAPGETKALTVGGIAVPLVACQADVWTGMHHVGETLSDLNNDLYAGNAHLWPAAACSTAVIPPVTPPVVIPPTVLCDDPEATNIGQPVPCTFIPPNKLCDDRNADNFGKPLPCVYPPPVAKCTDRNADNYGKALPCVYPVPCPIPGKKT